MRSAKILISPSRSHKVYCSSDCIAECLLSAHVTLIVLLGQLSSIEAYSGFNSVRTGSLEKGKNFLERQLTV